jgi:ribosome-associated protein
MKIKKKPARDLHGNSLPLVEHAITGIEEIKGNDIACLNLKKISNSPCDYFVICEGTSRTHVQAIAENVEQWIKKETGKRPWHVEGLQNAEWVLMDYIDVVIHIFQPDFRQHYGLEDMWADAVMKDLKPVKAVQKTKKAVVKRKKAAAKPKTKGKVPGKKAGAKKTIKKKVKK